MTDLSGRSTAANIDSLTSLRGVAAMTVVFYHLEPRLRLSLGLDSEIAFFANGQMMVDFFFLLSGFILAHVYAADPRVQGTWADTKSFFRKRFARVYPAHFFVLMLFVAYEIADVVLHRFVLHADSLSFTDTTSTESLFTNVFLLHAWGLHDTLTWNQPSWSISAELGAYLLFPLLAWRLGIRSSPAMAAICGTAAVAGLIFIQLRAGNLTGGATLGLPVCIAEFTLGLIAYFWFAMPGRMADTALGWLQVGVLTLIVLTLSFRLPDILAIPLFILLIVACRQDRGLIARLLCHPLPLWIGRISYSLYITHYFLVRIMDAPWQQAFPAIGDLVNEGSLLAVTVEFGLILLLAQLTYRFVEVPGRTWLRSRRSG
jgi:peptidoglycan/LPS O-acetylase OafA/YrhL